MHFYDVQLLVFATIVGGILLYQRYRGSKDEQELQKNGEMQVGSEEGQMSAIQLRRIKLRFLVGYVLVMGGS